MCLRKSLASTSCSARPIFGGVLLTLAGGAPVAQPAVSVAPRELIRATRIEFMGFLANFGDARHDPTSGTKGTRLWVCRGNKAL